MDRSVHLVAEAGSAMVVIGHFIVNGMPTVATLLAIAWYLTQIISFTTKTRRRRRKNSPPKEG